MRARKWLWVAGAFMALSGLLAFLSRPEDELAGLKRLKPEVRWFVSDYIPGQRFENYDFDQPIGSVLAQTPGEETLEKLPGREPYISVTFPSGRHGTISSWGAAGCSLTLEAEDLPWFKRAWGSFEHRLGL